MGDSAKLQAVIECPYCHNKAFKLIKMDTKDSAISIVCCDCDTTIGKVDDYFVKNCDD